MNSLPDKLTKLGLPMMSRQLDPVLAMAADRNLSAAATIEALVDLELEARYGRSVQRRFKLSRLHAQHSIDSFHFQHHKSRLQIKTVSCGCSIWSSSTRARTWC